MGSGSRPDDGFTLVEMLAALTLLALAVVATTAVFWSGLRTAAAGSHRTDASGIAVREIEALHAVPYAQLGFYADQSPSAWKGQSTVVLGPCSTTCSTPFAPLIVPSGTATAAGVTYALARYVYWADEQGVNTAGTSTTFSQAYKATTVTVTWTDQSGSH